MTTGSPADSEAAHPRLQDFLRSRQDEIIRDWADRVRALSPARELSVAAIVDHLPLILTRIADLVESAHNGQMVSLGDLPRSHAVDRLGRGFDLDQIVTEYRLLRTSILNLWEQHVGLTVNLAEFRNLDEAVDESISQAAKRYAQARERLLKALDRVSEAALGPGDLDTFLRDLLQATLHGTESVDTAVVLLREGDVLRVRAAVGIEDELHREYSITVREGFAGHVASEGSPVFLPHASTDPVVTSPAIRARGVRALYGVPLLRDGKVIGVAHIGSLTAHEFSDEDKLLFRTMVSRATSVIVKAQIVDDLRRTETAQRFLSEASRQFAESLDVQATSAKIARLAVPAIADWCIVDLLVDGVLRRVSVAHVDNGKEELARTLERQYPTDPCETSGIPHVLRTGLPEWQAEIADADLAASARDAEHLRILRELGLKSYIIVPIVARDRVLGAIALVTAESKRRYSDADVRVAEDLAGRVATAIENARLYTEAQQAVALREQVLAIVSHDLRNQLGVIAMGADLLARKAEAAAINPEAKKTLDTIRRTTTTMQGLLGDLLDMASIQAGRLSFEPEIVDIRLLLEDACEAHQSSARAHGLGLTYECPPSAIAVRGDRKRILQVLGNLLGNAIKFTQSGGAIDIDATVDDTHVTVAVKDTGRGIAPDDLPNIFEAYRTGHLDTGTGSGLGLYISEGIVQRHGGRMWVESEVGKGSTFFFTLPRAD